MTPGNAAKNRRRLDSWKEIAAFFDRDERTVSRWEKDLGLPIHRLPGTKGRVYAYSDELSDWLAGTRSVEPISPSETPAPLLTVVAAKDNPGAPVEPAPATNTPVTRFPKSSLLLAAAVIILAVLMVMFFHTPRTVTNTDGDAPPNPAIPSSKNSVQASSHPHNPEAEQLYLKGRYYWNKRTPDDLNKAVDYFTQAIVHDPNYAPAYVGLADCYNLLREYTAMPASEAYPRAYAAARKAVELDDQSSAAHASLAFVLFFGKWDISGAEAEFRRAISLDPNNAIAHHWYANYLLTLLRLPESLSEIERAQALDPTSTSVLADKGNILFKVGRQDEAIALLKQLEVTEPQFRSPHLYLKNIYLEKGDYPNFLAESKTDAALVHDNSAIAIANAAQKGFTAGGADGMFNSMLQVQKKLYAQGSLSPVLIAQTCALLGDKNGALQYLESAYNEHDELMLFVRSYPAFDRLLQEPEYRTLLERVNLPVDK